MALHSLRWWVRVALCVAVACAPAGCSGKREGSGAGQGTSRAGGKAARPASRPAARPPAEELRIVVDAEARSVSLAVRTAKQGTYAELKGAIEYVLVAAGGKEYETVFTTRHTPVEVYEAFSSIGLTRGMPAGQDTPPKGKPVRIFVEYRSAGKTVRRPVDELMLSKQTGKPLAPAEWVHTGSTEVTDPATGNKILQAELTQSLVGLHPSDSSPLVQNPRRESTRENIYLANAAALPAPTVPVRMIFRRVMPVIAPGVRRVRVFVHGRVQGVGFRAFTQRHARLLGVGGFVRNLPDGRVEAVVEGPGAKVAELLEKLKRGPRPARVEKVDAKDEPPEGDAKEFEVKY